MKNKTSVGFNSLAWVKHEIDHSLDLARTEINYYAEAPEKTHHLDRALSLLRDVEGTLGVAELEGAAMLAEESLEVIKALADQSVTNTEEACKQLIRALIQLPDYLDYVQTGQDDTPLVLVSVLNDLRAVRKVDFVSDKLGGISGLDNDGQLLDNQLHSGEDLQSIAELTRLVFELGLLGWYRNSNVEESLAKMALVCRRLRVASKHRASRRLWWSAEALTEALQTNRLEPTDAIKTLLGRVDREIKRLFSVGEDTFSATISLDLVKNLLYYIAISKPGNAIVDEVRNAYFLDDSPSAESLEGFQTSLSGHNKALNRSVAMSLAEDLEEIKEHLDHYHRSDNQSLDDLQVLIPLLSRLGETFTALNLSLQAEEVSVRKETLQTALSEKRKPTKQELEDVAQSLIEFEQSIFQFGINQQTIRRAGSAENKLFQPSDEQFDEVRSVVIIEVLADIDRCKAVIQRYVSGLCSIVDLKETLAYFSQVAGAMSLLNLESAGVLVTDIEDYIATKTEEKSSLDENQLDYLAESIAAVEVYLEVLEASKIQQESFIETGRSSLNILCAVQAEPVETGENTALLPISDFDDAFLKDDSTAGAPEIEEVLSFSAKTEQDSAIPVLSSEQEAEDHADISVMETESADGTMEIPDVGDLPDFELPADISADRSDYEADAPDLSMVQNHSDATSDSLIEMQALDIEDIDALREDLSSSSIFDEGSAESEALDLHELAATLTSNEGLETDFLFDESLIDSLQDQSPSEIQDLNLAASGEVGEAAIPTNGGDSNGGLPKIFHGLTVLGQETDAEIYDIFLEELSEEIDRLKQQFPKWKVDSAEESPLIQSRRSFHTIKGSGRLIGAQIIGEFAWVHETIFNQIINGALANQPEVIDCLEKGINLLPQLKRQLEQKQLPDDPVNQHIVWAEKVAAGKLGAAHDAVSDEAELPPVENIIDEFDAAAFESIDPLPTLSAISAENIDFIAADTSPEIDSELLEIFVADARGNVKVLREALAIVKSTETWRPGEAVTIAVHTLNGSARTANVKEIAEPFSACEKYLREKLNGDTAFDRQDTEALMTLADHATRVLEQLEANQARGSGDEFTHLFSELKANLQSSFQQSESADDHSMGEMPLDGDLDDLQSMMVEPAQRDEAGQSQSFANIDELVLEDPDLDPASLEIANPKILEVNEAQDPAESLIVLDSIDLPDSPAGGETLGATMVTELVSVFVEECQEILEHCDDAMVRWQKDTANLAPVDEIKRELHTLKGSARMAEVEEIGDLSHALETLLADVTEGRIAEDRIATNSDVISITHGVFDRINVLAQQVRDHQPLDSIQTELKLLDKVRAGDTLSDTDFRAIADGEYEADELTSEKIDSIDLVEELEQTPDEPVMEHLEGDLDLPAAIVAAPDADADSRIEEAIRIRAELLDKLVDNIGEVNVFHSRVEQQVGSFEFNLKELDQTVRRVTEQLRSLEMEAEAQILHRHKDLPINPDATGVNQHFDPLELDRYSKLQQLSRSLAESTGDLKNIHQLLVDEVASIDKILHQQSRVSNELQDGLMQTRMSKFKVMAPRLRRVVRRSAMDLGKEIELTMSGDNNELDRKMLESIIVPLEHLLRNAVAHGIESPEARQKAGKDEGGAVNVSISREGSQIVITVADNGAGINEEKVLAQAVKSGLIQASDKLTPEEIHSLILKPGFTTADEINQVAGRGVGMDVVVAQLKQLNGVLDIQSEPGKGSEFRISIPFTLAINQALLVTANKQQYAVPMGSIEGVLQVAGKSLAEKISSEAGTLSYAGENFKIAHLSSMLEKVAPQALEDDHVYPLLLGRVGENQVAFIIDEILGNREIVVKPVGPMLSSLEGISGATILGDGQIVLIVDIAGMIRQTLQEQDYKGAPKEEVEQQRKLIMVVDDSITIRKVTTRMLERHNFKVVTAKDGLDAVAQLQEVIPDMMLLDIEMPRMDGFELAEHVRSSDVSSDLPIIMISSRTGKKHRQRAQQLGVNQFLGKPYQDQELLENINFLLEGGEIEQNRVVH